MMMKSMDKEIENIPGDLSVTASTRIPDSTYLIRFRRYFNQNGNKHKKMDSIDSFVFSLFENVRTKSIVIHDTDQQRWARKTAEKLSFTDFLASSYWVHYLKRQHNIVSRKITKLSTKHAEDSEDDMTQSAEPFVGDVRLYIYQKSYSGSASDY